MTRAPRSAPNATRERPRRARRVVRGLLLVLGLLVAVGAASVAATWWLYDRVCPGPCADTRQLAHYQPTEASIVLDRDEHEIGRFFTENRRVVPIESLPPILPAAFVAVEDQRFYEHDGVDLPGLVVAARDNLLGRHRGASTITMQLARNAYPELLPYRERTLTRKLREIRVAREIEQALTKRQILAAYLNTINLGAGAYGVDAAARTYFGKPAHDLTLPEAALLAALPKAPTTYNPYRHPEAARRRRDLVLALMRDQGRVSADEAARAMAAPLGVLRLAPRPSVGVEALVAPYFIAAVRTQLLPILGDDLFRGGLRIHTTLDAHAQATAEAALETRLTDVESGREGRLTRPSRAAVLATLPADTTQALDVVPYLQGAALVVDVDSGDVVAMVGGRSFRESHFNRATQAVRQPGSAFKPFVYAAALDQGWHPNDLVVDDPIAVPLADGSTWSPTNFDPREAGGAVSMTQALVESRNRAAVWLAQQVTLDSVIATAHAMGLATPLTPYPSLPLGVIGVRMPDLVRAYTPIARDDGQAVTPRLVTRVETRDGRTLYAPAVTMRPTIPTPTLYVLRRMLMHVVDEGTGGPIRQAGYTGPAAGKTGTTNDGTDAWFVGVTPHYAAAVWVGYDSPETVLHGAAGTGGRLAGPVWGAIMRQLEPGLDSLHSWQAPDSADARTLWKAPALADSLHDGETVLDDSSHTPTDDRLCVRPPELTPTPPKPGQSNLVPCRVLRSLGLDDSTGTIPDSTSPSPTPETSAPGDSRAPGDTSAVAAVPSPATTPRPSRRRHPARRRTR